MVVRINGNGLLPPGRRELFASTRERATESDVRQKVYDLVAQLLRTDDELKHLNYEEKETPPQPIDSHNEREDTHASRSVHQDKAQGYDCTRNGWGVEGQGHWRFNR